MNILLIGHSGYVGSGLFRYLSYKHKVIGWGRKEDIQYIGTPGLKKLGISVVINCAAIIDRITSNYIIDSPSDLVNVIGMRKLVSALEDTDIKLIYISTKDVYGSVYSKKDVNEDDYSYKLKYLVDDNQPFSPESIYGKSKLIGEFLAESYRLSTVIRLSTCYTDYDHYRGHWIPNVIKSLQKKNQVVITNKGKQTRDILHVDDLGRLIEIVIESSQNGNKINAGGGPDNIISLLQMIHLVDNNAETINADGSDYGFAFNNRLAEELYKWRPNILFSERLETIKENLFKGISANI